MDVKCMTPLGSARGRAFPSPLWLAAEVLVIAIGGFELRSAYLARAEQAQRIERLEAIENEHTRQLAKAIDAGRPEAAFRTLTETHQRAGSPSPE